MGLFNKNRVDKVMDSAIKGIDALFFTKEEKAQQSIKLADAQVDYLKSTLSENSARSITRRYLALGIIGVFLFLIVASGAMFLIDKEYSKFLFELAKSLNTLVMMVAGFFFGAYMIGSHLFGKNTPKRKEK